MGGQHNHGSWARSRSDNGDDHNVIRTPGHHRGFPRIPACRDEHLVAEQLSSVVAEHHADWDEQVATTEANCLDPLGTIACSLGYQTLGLKAQTIWLALTAVHKPSSLVDKGVPPDKIADLLSETESAADATGIAADALVAANCPDPMATECITEYLAVSRAVSGLSRKLDAWSVY